MFPKIATRISLVVALALVVWTFTARPSGAHGPKTVYHVHPHDTLWTIAAAHYGGDTRQAVWRIETVNHLGGSAITPGERLLLP